MNARPGSIPERLARLEEQMRAVHAELADMHQRGTEQSRGRLHQLEQYNAASKAAEAALSSAKSAIAAGNAQWERRFFLVVGLGFTAAGFFIGLFL